MGEGVGAMKKNRSKTALPRVCIALVILMGVMLCISPALAETLSVSGTDYLYTPDAEDDAVDVLTITGPQDATVYINMYRGEEVLASHLGFTLDEYSAQADDNGDMVGIASVEFNAQAFSNDDAYTIEVFADREETQLLYAGTVSTVFAKYGDAVEALAVRTLSEGEQRPMSIPKTRDYNGVAYKLASDEPVDHNGGECYVYELADSLAESIDAHVTYFDVTDPTGEPIKTETITLAQGSSQDMAIESIVSADDGNTFYRTLQLSDKVTVAYPGTTEYAIMCKRLSDDWNAVGSFYKAIIRYTDAKGTSLGFKDSVIVNKSYTYTAPTVLYVKDGDSVKEYQIQNREDAVLHLSPGDADGEKTYDVVYEPVADDAERTWTVVIENGSVAPYDAERELDRITYKGKPGTEVTHTTLQELTVGDTTYVPTASAQESYTHTFASASMGVEQTIYYVPEGYVAPEPYEVVVKYINIATNEVIDTATYTASPSMRADLELETPESFSKGGIEWIRLNGQEAALRHGFYSDAREYAVYYRDVNDELHKDTVIRTVRVVYKDEDGNTVTRPTTVRDNGTTDNGTTDNGTTTTDNGTTTTQTDEGVTATTTEAEQGPATNQITVYETVTEDEAAPDVTVNPTGADDATANANANANATTDTGLQTGEDILSVSGADGDTLVARDGTDLGTMRIEDDETPLAGPGSQEVAGKVSVSSLAMGGIGAAVATGLILFFIFKRRKQDKDAEDPSDDEPLA